MIITKKLWMESKKDFKTFIDEYYDDQSEQLEIDDELYYYWLGVLPPIYQDGYWLCSEPYTNAQSGRMLYFAFMCKDDKFYYIGLKTKN
jgi:hypothetical protein